MLELMRHSKLVGAVSNCAVSAYHGTYAVRLETAPTGGESVLLFLESTINDPSRSRFTSRHQIVDFGKSTYSNDTICTGLGNPPNRRIIVDVRINETLQIGRRCFQLRRFSIPRHLCGAVRNRTYRGRKCSFIFRIHYK